MEIALERSVRNAFNGGSRYIRLVHNSPDELMFNGNSSTGSSGSSAAAAAAGAGPGKAIRVKRNASADVGLRHGGAFLDACVVDGDFELAVQCGTSLQEQERALEQCRARRCSTPLSVPAMRGEGIPPAHAGTRQSSKRNAEASDPGLAALYGTSLREQEKAWALCRGRLGDIPRAASRPTKDFGKGQKP